MQKLNGTRCVSFVLRGPAAGRADGSVVQELAGHSDIRVTMNVYGHVFPGMHGQAMDDFDRKFRTIIDK